MNSINPLQAALQNLYNQLATNVPPARAGMVGPDMLHSLGLSANLLQNLRNDLSAVASGSNPERSLNNLLAGLQQLGGARELIAGMETSAGAKHLDLVKGKDGQPKELTMTQEWLPGKEVLSGAKHLDLMKGEDGQAKEVTPAKERPECIEPPKDGLSLVKGEDGQPQEFNEWPAGKELPKDGIFYVKGEDGQLTEISASEAQLYQVGSSKLSVQAHADAVISNLKSLLDTEAVGGDISQPTVALRSALQSLFDNNVLASNPEQVRDALRNSIYSLA